jgi:signal transduction histidine kinase
VPELLRAVALRFPNGSINVFDRELRYVFAAGEGLATAGLSPSALIRRRLSDVFTPDAVAYVAPIYNRVLCGESVQFELPVFGRVYSISAGPLVEDGDTVTRIVAVAQDITAMKDVQRQLEATERELRLALGHVERESARKDQFLATVAHELQQPCRPVWAPSRSCVAAPVRKWGVAPAMSSSARCCKSPASCRT